MLQFHYNFFHFSLLFSLSLSLSHVKWLYVSFHYMDFVLNFSFTKKDWNVQSRIFPPPKKCVFFYLIYAHRSSLLARSSVILPTKNKCKLLYIENRYIFRFSCCPKTKCQTFRFYRSRSLSLSFYKFFPFIFFVFICFSCYRTFEIEYVH